LFVIFITTFYSHAQVTETRKNPKRQAAGHFGAGRKAYKNQDYESAYNQFKKAIALNSEKAGYFYMLGTTALHLRLYSEAANALNKAKSLDPDLKFTHDKRVFEDRLKQALERSSVERGAGIAEPGQERNSPSTRRTREQAGTATRSLEENETSQRSTEPDEKMSLTVKIGFILLGIAVLLAIIYVVRSIRKKNS